MKKIILLALLAFAVSSCELDYYPSDAMTSTQLGDNPAFATYSTDGNYSMFKDILEYKGTAYSANTYMRHYLCMAEYHGDNAALCGKTTDALYGQICYNDLATDSPNAYLWWCAYHIIYGVNAVIEGLPAGTSPAQDHMLGENYFMRAICHLHLATLYARPYSMGRENPGIIIRTTTKEEPAVRASVGDVYDQIRDDLIQAAQLMEADESRVENHGYISRDAALGLLSRVYLYREENEEVINTVNAMLNGASPMDKLETGAAYENYFANALTSKETLWCIAYRGIEDYPSWTGKESYGSMLYTADSKGGTGWAEIYYSDPLVKLFKRHPEDLRFTAHCQQLHPVEGAYQVRWSVEDPDNNFRLNEIHDAVQDAAGNWSFVDNNGQKVRIKAEKDSRVKGQINYSVNGTPAYIDTKCDIGNTLPMFMCRKFTGQDGIAMLSSPVMLRWAEVILNRAEAYAKLGRNADALADVNVIRRRAGIPEYTEGNIGDGGYNDVLSVILDERRMEFCFEGHRAFDLYRNKRKMDRRFSGVQPWEEVDYTDPRILYYIPYDEISVSGIAQNDR